MAEKSQEGNEEKVKVGAAELTLIKGGSGKPLLVLHGELGFPGWIGWLPTVAQKRTVVVPQHPGYGKSPQAEWIMSMRDLAGFYARFLREQHLDPVDVIGFSLGGWLAAEMAAQNPRQFSKMILVGATGVRPPSGEIRDMFTVTARAFLDHSVLNHKSAEFAALFGGKPSTDQYEAWEDARTQSARLAWSPYMFNPSLPHLLEGVTGLPTLILWGKQDDVVPLSVAEVYKSKIAGSKLVTFDQCGHMVSVDKPAEFAKEVLGFLG